MATNQEQLTEVDKIGLILDAALELAKDNGYQYLEIIGIDSNTSKSEFTKLLKARVNEKKHLIGFIPKESLTYKSILENARKVVQCLKRHEYSVSVANLIKSVCSLEEVFANGLGYVGEKLLEETTPEQRQENELNQLKNDFRQAGMSEEEIESCGAVKNILYLEEGVTGEKLEKIRMMEEELEVDMSELEGLELEEEDNELSSEDISKLGLDEEEGEDIGSMFNQLEEEE